MCKPIRIYWQLLLCATLALIVFFPAQAQQPLASNQTITTQLAQDDKSTSLEQVLNQIKDKYEVTFGYQEEVVSGKKVNGQHWKDQDLESALKTILTPLNLDYTQLDRVHYVIKPKSANAPAKLQPNPIKQTDQRRYNRSTAIKRTTRQSFQTSQSLEQTINGQVTDLSTSEPLPGVNILAKGTSTGTVSDMDGNYRLTVADDITTLVFSSIGYETVEESVNGRAVINLSLSPDIQSLSEVVVVGYGTQEKVNLTGSISTVNSEELNNRPITNASQALQGVQGVYVNQAGGQPGRDGATIRIRGVGTLNNSNPLVLVDGIEFSLSDINPNDIESISVLKDAASAAIYGSRAANGVILVTTKSGKEGRSEISYNNYFGLQEVISLPDVVEDPILWMNLYSQAQLNVGTDPAALAFPQSLIDEFAEGMSTDPFTYPNNDWQDIMFDPAFIHEHNLRFSGGTAKTTYALSLGALGQDGVMRGTGSERYNLNLNLRSDISNRFTVGGTINTSYRKFNEPVTGIANTMQMTLKAQSYHPTYLEDGRYGDLFFFVPGHRNYRHPLALADEGSNDFTNLRLFLNTFLEVKLPLDIKYKVNLGVNSTGQRQKRFTPDVFSYNMKSEELSRRIDYNFGWQRGTYQRDSESLNTTLFNTLQWDKAFGKNELNVLLGTSVEVFQNSFFSAYNEGYLSNDLTELNAGSSNPAVSGSSTESRLNSYFGRVGYIYNEKYLLEGNFRYDGSSRFAKENRWGFFPSVSAGWRINEEAFLQDVNWLDQLKVRASWGQLGNERIGLFRYADLINLGQDYAFGGNINPGAAVTVDNDNNISWETTTITNLGVDAAFAEGKLNATFEYFIKETDDILRPVGIPYQVGALGGPVRNIGAVRNAGFEVGLGYRNTHGDFSYEVLGNLTYITNEVTKLDEEVIINNLDNRGLFSITQEGSPIDQFLLYQADGIFQSQEEIDAHAFQGNDTQPGYLRFKDLNSDGTIDIEDRVGTGNTIPRFTYTFNVNLSYRNLSLTTFWQGVDDAQTYNNHITGVPFWFGTALPVEWVDNSWTPDNPGASLPILTRYQDAVNTNFRPSDFWLLDASYLRLKNIQLTYQVDNSLVERLGLSRLSVFVNGQNMLTFTDLKHFDPEQDLLGGNFFEYPSVRTYTAGVNLTF